MLENTCCFSAGDHRKMALNRILQTDLVNCCARIYDSSIQYNNYTVYHFLNQETNKYQQSINE